MARIAEFPDSQLQTGQIVSSEHSAHDSDLDRISRINTQWTLLRQAHQPQSVEQAQEARAAVVRNYISPIYRYLNRIMHDAEAAEDVAHDIVLKLMQGQMSGATQARGRFRDYLKTVLINSARSWKMRNARNPVSVGDVVEPSQDSEEQAFDTCVRDEVMQAAWKDLGECERVTQQPFASVLRWRSTVGATSTDGLQDLLKNVTGCEYSGSNARKVLQRAREHFAHLLVERVRQLLPPEHRDLTALEDELLALGLHKTCQSALRNSGSR